MENVDPPQLPDQLGPQPDFARLRQVLEQATTEFGNFANLPPFTQGNALVQQMQQFQQQMQQFQQQMQQQSQQLQQLQQSQQQMQQQLQQQMNQNFTTVRNDIQTLRNDININHRATEYNSIARLQNSVARKPDHPLTVLRDYATNTDIPGFPATPAQLANMAGVGLDPILRSLGLPVNGTAGIKRQRLKFYIGLADMP